MKQVELLDLVLKALYEEPDKRGEIVELLTAKGVNITLDEAHRLGRRLNDAGLVKFNATRDSALVDMKSEGLEFVEGSSFAHTGHPVINNHYTISNSPNANLVSQSAHVTISQNATDIRQIIDQIKHQISQDGSIDTAKRNELTECLEEIETVTAAGKTPKYAFKSFIEMAADMSSIGGLVIQLAQAIGA